MKNETLTKKVLNILLYTFIGALVTSCSCGSKQIDKYVCSCKEREQLQVFVNERIKDANNMSDEEMEDVIYQLRIDGVKIYCHKEAVWVKYGERDIDWTKQKFDSCRIITDVYVGGGNY